MTRDDYIKKLERRICMQRCRLRWWENNHNQHVHGQYWRKVISVRAHLKEAAFKHGLTLRRARARKIKANQ